MALADLRQPAPAGQPADRRRDRPGQRRLVRLRSQDLGVTLERLRVDRQLKELLGLGPDPLHFTAVFGVTSSAGMLYARSAAAMLELQLGQTAGESPDGGPAA